MSIEIIVRINSFAKNKKYKYMTQIRIIDSDYLSMMAIDKHLLEPLISYHISLLSARKYAIELLNNYKDIINLYKFSKHKEEFTLNAEK